MKISILVLAIIYFDCRLWEDITDRIVKISAQCGGVDKINRIWIDGETTKAYCNDGRELVNGSVPNNCNKRKRPY